MKTWIHKKSASSTTSLSFQTIFGAMLLCLNVAPIFHASAQQVYGLPIHTNAPKQFKIAAKEAIELLKGPQNLIHGEYVTWTYPFDWIATTASGKKQALQQGHLLTFLGTNTYGFIVEIKGLQYHIKTPPHTAGAWSVFKLAKIELEGVSADIVKNRLGAPTQIINTTLEGAKYLYKNELTKTYTGFDVTVSEFENARTGSGEPIYGTFTTRTPYTETATYTLYSFVIHFDAKDKVQHIEDLAPTTVKYTRKTSP